MENCWYFLHGTFALISIVATLFNVIICIRLLNEWKELRLMLLEEQAYNEVDWDDPE